MRKLNVLLSAYCCEPDRGSEPAVGWNIALALSRYHNVWVLTRAANRKSIEAGLPREPVPGLHFVYYDLPRWGSWWKRGMRGLQLYYYLWQIGAGRKALSLNRTVHFDITHHLTLGRYWTPSLLWRIPVPFIWGPVGGGEAAPPSYYRSYSWRGRLYESVRTIAQVFACYDPLLRLTARRSQVALVATPQTERRLIRLGAKSVKRISGQTGVSGDEAARLAAIERQGDTPFRVLTVGRLLHWKGVHLGLSAFARANLPGAEYWILGDGPEAKRLRELSKQLGIQEKVVFWGQIPHDRALTLLGACDVLLHPSVHDFSPTVVFEAMAAGMPVLCLELGGLPAQVAPETGLVVPAANPRQAVEGLADGMRLLQSDGDLRRRLGNAGRERLRRLFMWDRKVQLLLEVYSAAVEERPTSFMHAAPAASAQFVGVGDSV